MAPNAAETEMHGSPATTGRLAAASLPVPAGPVEVGPLFALDQAEFAANLTGLERGPVFDRS